jgi:beta-lactamase regulating signal transducer with metallopeptidase domain
VSHSLSTLAGLLVGGPTAIVIKATLVLATAALAVVAFRRASAAFRHLIWLLGLSACAALALLSPAAPTIAVDVPVPAVTEQLPRTKARSINATARRRDLATTVISVGGGSSIPVAITVAPSMTGEPVGRVDLSRAIASYAPVFVLGVWILGCLTILARCVMGHRRIRRVIDAAEPLASAEWNAALETASIDLRFRGDVDLLVSDALPAPITSGFFRPVIVLPAECRSWDAERRRIVLTHELAHIARLDYAAQLVGTIACALFWFHPAVWFAASQLRVEAEHAADDRVLGAGTLGVTYATHLLDLARGDHTGALSPAMSVGMIRSSHLEGRFRAMLDSTRSRDTDALRDDPGRRSSDCGPRRVAHADRRARHGDGPSVERVGRRRDDRRNSCGRGGAGGIQHPCGENSIRRRLDVRENDRCVGR